MRINEGDINASRRARYRENGIADIRGRKEREAQIGSTRELDSCRDVQEGAVVVDGNALLHARIVAPSQCMLRDWN